MYVCMYVRLLQDLKCMYVCNTVKPVEGAIRGGAKGYVEVSTYIHYFDFCS